MCALASSSALSCSGIGEGGSGGETAGDGAGVSGPAASDEAGGEAGREVGASAAVAAVALSIASVSFTTSFLKRDGALGLCNRHIIKASTLSIPTAGQCASAKYLQAPFGNTDLLLPVYTHGVVHGVWPPVKWLPI